MRLTRIVSTCSAVAAVGACGVLALGMAHAATMSDAQAGAQPATSRSTAATSIPAQLPGSSTTPASASATPSTSTAPGTTVAPPPTASDTLPPTTSAASTRAPAARVPATHPATSATSRPASSPTSVRTTPPAPAQPAPTHARTPAPTHAPTHEPTHAPTHAPTRTPAPVRGHALPLPFATHDATHVITVVAHSHSSTVATLQAWRKAPGGGWLRVRNAITAHVGAAGISRHPSESRSATPAGSFSLTRAFGRYSDPGTRLPYLHTTPADWWISQPGSLYNTLQVCSSDCPFNQGDPNEHLYYETPYYDYAVVIDYNTRNAGPVRQGAGSAFFLHVTDYRPTAGCVSIPMDQLVPLMRWLGPLAHPRILIGVT